MAYRKPFTPLQRREALRAIRSYQKHQRLLRRKYAPADAEQSQILIDYDDAISKMEDELTKLDRAINTNTLNKMDAVARWLATEYWRLRGRDE